MTAYFATAAAVLAMLFPDHAPAAVATALASPVGEIATVLALTLGAANIAAAYLFPGRRY